MLWVQQCFALRGCCYPNVGTVGIHGMLCSPESGWSMNKGCSPQMLPAMTGGAAGDEVEGCGFSTTGHG